MWLLALAALAKSPAPIPSPVPAQPPPHVAPTLAAASPPVHWLFAIDTSAELLPVSAATLPDIARLVEILPVGDQVEILVFHARPNLAMPATTVDDAGRAALAAKIRALTVTAGVDRDLGAGLAALRERLDREDAPPFQFVTVVSNFCHEPPVGSPWSTGGSGCTVVRGARELRGAFEAGAKGRYRQTWLFPISAPKESPDALGLDAAAEVTDGAIVMETFASWAGAYQREFDRLRVGAMVARQARDLVVRAGAAKRASTDDPVAKLALSSASTIAGVRLSEVTIQGGSLGGTAPIVLSPRAEIEVAVDPPSPRFALFPQRDTVQVPVTLRATATLLPEDEVRAVGTNPDRGTVEVQVAVPYERRYGLPGYASFLLFTSVFLGTTLGTAWLRQRLVPRRLGGTFGYRFRGGPKIPMDLASRAEAAICVQPDGALALGARAEAVLVLRVRRRAWTTVSEVEVLADGMELNGKPLARGVHPVVPGTASFRFGEHRLAWE